MRSPSKKNHDLSGQPTLMPHEQCLAKTWKLPDRTVAGRTVLDHCLIVGHVAHAMVQRMPLTIQKKLFPEGAALVAATHDIGKVSPTFQKKIHSALSDRDMTILSQLTVNVDEKQWGGHAGVSQATLARMLGAKTHVPQIVGKHHGFTSVGGYDALAQMFGAEPWNAQREELVQQLKEGLAMDFPCITEDWQADVVAGLTSVADWVGSGRWFEDPSRDWRSYIDTALDEAGFVRPMFKPNLTFEQIFGFEPKQTQVQLIEAAQKSGLYILEAPMGLGKTEAALYAAYRLLHQESATGIYFALPTQLTSDKIYERVRQFLSKVLTEDSLHHHAHLLHGNAWLSSDHMGEEGNPGGSWFAQGKRGILAPFAVGTMDQALMSVMNVKHGFVRSFGLAGKVVILDEVHSYDSFTGTIVDHLIERLRALDCTVIVLSATLTTERKKQLLGIQPTSDAYPLITAYPQGEAVTEYGVPCMPDHSVIIHKTHEDEALEEALLRAEMGQQVLWIENTVQQAQSIYQQCAARMADTEVTCGLLHSRFTKHDRREHEARWIDLYGKNAQTRSDHGRILVGTQILEQSIDIDADFLVTRIAPTDMILQRIGRLWRHAATPRPASALQEAWIIAPDSKAAIENPKAYFGSSASVYAPYVLCRSLEVWEDRSQIHLPRDIRPLMEATYAPREEVGHMKAHEQEVVKMREKLQNIARGTLAHSKKTLPEEHAQTRYSELETIPILLVRDCQKDVQARCTHLIVLDGTPLSLPWNGRALPRTMWREYAGLLMQHTLTVAQHHAPVACLRKDIEWLQDYIYIGNIDDGEMLLRLGLVRDDGTICTLHQGQANTQFHLAYDDEIGYSATRN